MTRDECNEALRENLSESIDHAIDLRTLLTEEREALERKDTMSLTDTAARKQLCINKLEELEKSRAEMSEACGFGKKPNDIARLAGNYGPDDLLTQSWDRFLDIARECSEVNSGNGAIIRVRQDQIKSAISLLRDGSTDAGTYGPDGRDGEDHRSRPLAEA